MPGKKETDSDSEAPEELTTAQVYSSSSSISLDKMIIFLRVISFSVFLLLIIRFSLTI